MAATEKEIKAHKKLDHDLLKRINQKRFSLAKKRNKSVSLRQVSREAGVPHSTFFSVLYGKSKGSSKGKILAWIKKKKD